MFRFKLDIEVGDDETAAAEKSRKIVDVIIDAFKANTDIKEISYLMSNDNDRTVRNYLVKDENGHVATKKFRVGINEPMDA